MPHQPATRKRRKPSRLWVRAPYDARSEIVAPRFQHLITNLSLLTAWRLRRRGEFPEPIVLSPGRKGYIRRELEDWVAAKAARRA
jgi:predicted DNA-binding transcriptional regulator AlpA